MKKYIKLIFMTMMVCCLGLLTACGGKSPEPGYVTMEEVESKYINNLSTDKQYSEYSVKGDFNFRDTPVLDFPEDVDVTKSFNASLEEYSVHNASYYLMAPLQITKENWIVLEAGEESLEKSAKHVLIQGMYQVNNAYNDTFYVYLEEDGSFSIKSFGVNKAIRLFTVNRLGKKKKRLVAKGKYDITLKYNKEGFLVEESFETINSHKDPKSETCYGHATYSYN